MLCFLIIILENYEVTQQQYQVIMGTNPSYFEKCDDCPVENVSWEDIQLFLRKLNQKLGKNYRLPTEAEWEYTARSRGKNTMFGNGKNIIKSNDVNFHADVGKKFYSELGVSRKRTIPVGSLNSPNSLGVHDMSGNVWEWCQDWYGDYTYGSKTNPTGAYYGDSRVLRGGSWSTDPPSCRTSYRNYNAIDKKFNTVGFRLALSVQ